MKDDPSPYRVRIAVLADAANLSDDGKLNLMGEFNRIFSPSAPGTWPRLFYALKLELSAIVTGMLEVEVRFVSPDGLLILAPLRGHVDTGTSPDGNPRYTVMALEVHNLVLPAFGEYTVELWKVNEAVELLDAFPLFFIQVPAQA